MKRFVNYAEVSIGGKVLDGVKKIVLPQQINKEYDPDLQGGGWIEKDKEKVLTITYGLIYGLRQDHDWAALEDAEMLITIDDRLHGRTQLRCLGCTIIDDGAPEFDGKAASTRTVRIGIDKILPIDTKIDTKNKKAALGGATVIVNGGI